MHAGIRTCGPSYSRTTLSLATWADLRVSVAVTTGFLAPCFPANPYGHGLATVTTGIDAAECVTCPAAFDNYHHKAVLAPAMGNPSSEGCRHELAWTVSSRLTVTCRGEQTSVAHPASGAGAAECEKPETPFPRAGFPAWIDGIPALVASSATSAFSPVLFRLAIHYKSEAKRS